MTCNGLTCKRLRAKKPITGSRYAAGQKRCQTCEIFINWDGIFCPCCTTRLRGRPRKMEYKDKCKTQIEIQGGIISHNIIEACKKAENETTFGGEFSLD